MPIVKGRSGMTNRRSALIFALFLCGFLVVFSSAQQRPRNYVAPVSPRIEAFRKEIEGGNRTASETFWQQFARDGAPLIESIPGDNERVLVTFLWRANQEIQNVVLIGAMTAELFADNQMTHLPGTDVWYKTYEVRNDARFTYSFSLNDPLTTPRDLESAMRMPRYSAPLRDQLNPHTFVYPGRGNVPFGEEEKESVVELSRTPKQPWTVRRPDLPAGQVEIRHVKSAILGNEREVWVYTPVGYSAKGAPYNLLVLFDGWWYNDNWIPTRTILDNLIERGLVPPTVAVLVDNSPPEQRNTELVHNASFADFIAKELVPWVRQSYHVSSDPARNVVGGLSNGGLAAAFIAWRHSDVFGNVQSQSGAFWQGPTSSGFTVPEETEFEWLTKQYATSPKLPLRIYLEAGLFENACVNQGPSLLTANRHLRDILEIKGYTFRYKELSGCNHVPLCWRGTLADGLIFLAEKKPNE